MPRVKKEPKSPQGNDKIVSKERDEIDERFDELDFVEESAGDDFDADDSHQPPSTPLSAPRSPDADGIEETVVLNAGEDDDENPEKRLQMKDEHENHVGPKTPPEGERKESNEEDVHLEKSDLIGARKRRHSSNSSSSRSLDSESSRSRSPPQTYKETEEMSVEERIRQNKKARLIRLREARSRQIGYEYVAPAPKHRGLFPLHPYFKNPSYYPQEQRGEKARAPAPPPPAQKIEPLPGGRLPLVQRRSSPPPYDRNTSRRRSPIPVPTRRRRTIVEEVSRVSGRSPPSRRSRSPSYRRGNRISNLGPQTLYPSRSMRNGTSSRDSYDRSSSYRNGSSNYSSDSGGYIFTGTKYVPRPFIPPPPPGKKWNCPRREEPYVPPDKKPKWRCPQREPETPPRQY